ncbi:hypothetical protein [Burkholderia cepacia]|uniref:hypothetical protein n=1 Tax=Burkholderia cepacia TaxID=292 RepID=UPI0012D894C0|nr:hypothetical protein [Burkholderia cepacia]UQO39369.1 hypothetical protein L0Z22_38005 [Burkholderia cepacia]UQO49782.1 hypothetical protein L0Z05_17885 [Burkholderia cepacia]UQP09451.1 hypothetical protein L0Z01_37990 [Burkholderia cepacia]
MKKIAALMILAFSASAHCEVRVEDYCFVSIGGKPVRFELRTYSDDSINWSGAVVRYERSLKSIPLVLLSENIDEVEKGRPAEISRRWAEILNGSISGEYEMSSQGGNINSMTYKNNKTKKKFDFDFDVNAQRTDGMGCNW